MRIYPDTELPDVEVEWEGFDCSDATGDVRIELRTFDSDELRREVTAPCTARSVTIPDVDRQRYRVDGYLLDRAGDIYSVTPAEADLRNGLGERVQMYWGGYANLTFAWKFEGDAICTSLDVSAVALEHLREGFDDFEVVSGASCDRGRAWLRVLPGALRIRLRAVTFDGPVATVALSEPSPELTVAEMARTDAGTLLLVPCSTACPP